MVLRKKMPSKKPLPSDYEERLERYKKRYEKYKKRLGESVFKVSKELKQGKKKYFITYYTNAGRKITVYVNKIPKKIFKKYGAVKEVGLIPGIEEKSLKEAEEAVEKAVKSKRRIKDLPSNERYGHVKFKLTEKGLKKGLSEHDYSISGRKIQDLYNEGLIKKVTIIKK